MELLDCRECGLPAEVRSSLTIPSTSGSAEHRKITCVQRHWYLLPPDLLAAPASAGPAGTSSATSDSDAA
jgi:hypothetical protein